MEKFSVNLEIPDWMNLVGNTFAKYNVMTIVSGENDFEHKDTLFWDLNNSDRLFIEGVFAELDRISDGGFPSLYDFVSEYNRTLRSVVEKWQEFESWYWEQPRKY